LELHDLITTQTKVQKSPQESLQSYSPPHLTNQVTHLLGERWPARCPSLAQAPPVRTEALTLPGNNRAGLDKCERVLPPGPEPREPDPEETISRVEPRARHRLLVDGHLMPECEVFQTERSTRSEKRDDKGEQG